MSKAPAVDYALQIIEFFASQDREIGIADISNALGINKNAVSRVLESLTEKSWIYISDPVSKKYRLTMRPFSVMSAAVEGQELVGVARPIIEGLLADLGDSVYLGIRNGANVQYLIHYDSTKEVRISGRVGGQYPLNCSAPGKVLLSYGGDGEIETFFSTKAEARTENTITDRDAFLLEAKKIKEMGYALDDEEFAKGILCIALPVFDHKGEAVASIGISSLTIYDTKETLISEKYPALKLAADKISASLGYRKHEKKYE